MTPESAAETLTTVFREIHRERMADVPILNEALDVEAVGFVAIDAGVLGVLVTPWFMNLMLLPTGEGDFAGQHPGEKTVVPLPAGDYEFIAGSEDGIGDYRMCSLFSPVFEFGDHATAVATAEAVMAGVLTVPEPAAPEPVKAAPARSVSRRDLFRGLAGAE